MSTNEALPLTNQESSKRQWMRERSNLKWHYGTTELDGGVAGHPLRCGGVWIHPMKAAPRFTSDNPPEKDRCLQCVARASLTRTEAPVPSADLKPPAPGNLQPLPPPVVPTDANDGLEDARIGNPDSSRPMTTVILEREAVWLAAENLRDGLIEIPVGEDNEALDWLTMMGREKALGGSNSYSEAIWAIKNARRDLERALHLLCQLEGVSPEDPWTRVGKEDADDE